VRLLAWLLPQVVCATLPPPPPLRPLLLALCPRLVLLLM
jgi:hypothetical protein